MLINIKIKISIFLLINEIKIQINKLKYYITLLIRLIYVYTFQISNITDFNYQLDYKLFIYYLLS